MQACTFVSKVKEITTKYFPNGYTHISKMALGGGVCIRLGMIGDQTDWHNGIQQNDPLSVLICIHDMPFDAELDNTKKYVAEFGHSSLSVMPKQFGYAMSSEKIASRKINNTPEKMLVALDKYFKRCQEVVLEQAQAGKIYNQENLNVKYIPQ